MKKQTCLQKTIYSLLLLTSVSAFSEQISTRIVGGSDATNSSEYPWIVSLKYNSGQHFCGASLIDKQWLLTAAHCVLDATTSSFTATIGEYDLSSAPATARTGIEQIIIHPDYNSSTFNNDLALIKLDSSSAVEVLSRLSSSDTEDLISNNDSTTTAIGWGSTIAYSSSDENASSDYPDILQSVELPLLSAASCKEAMPMTNDNMICAGDIENGGIDSCQGDSGGPLLTSNNEQIGIVSFGAGCAQPNNPGVYTKVANYDEWIENEISGFGVTNKTDYFVTESGVTKTYSIDFQNHSDLAISPTFSFSNTTEFTLQNNTCESVASLESCSITLSFTSSELGSYINTISIDTNNTSVPSPSVEVQVSVMEKVDANSLNFTENSQVTWLQSSTTPWLSSDQNYVSSPSISNNQSSQISAVISGTGILKFNWAVSSEQSFDLFNLFIDGELQASISGNQQFTEQRFEISGSESLITWQYIKDDSKAGGLDTAYLHNARLIQSSDESGEDILSAPILDFNGNAATVFKSSGGGGSIHQWSLFVLILLALYKQGLPLTRITTIRSS